MFGQKLHFHPPLKFPTHFCQNNPFKVPCQTCMQMRNTLTQSSCGQTLLPAEQTYLDRTSYTWQKALVSYSILGKYRTALIHILYHEPFMSRPPALYQFYANLILLKQTQVRFSFIFLKCHLPNGSGNVKKKKKEDYEN